MSDVLVVNQPKVTILTIGNIAQPSILVITAQNNNLIKVTENKVLSIKENDNMVVVVNQITETPVVQEVVKVVTVARGPAGPAGKGSNYFPGGW